MNLLFIPTLLAGDYRTFFIKMCLEFGLWLIVVVAALIDLNTGIKASKAIGCSRTTSRGLRQTFKKIAEYFTYLSIAFLFDFAFSYLTTLTDIFSVLGLFKIPVFTLATMLALLVVEWISVRENLDKARGKKLISPEAYNTILDLAGSLAPEQWKAVAEIFKIKEPKL